MSLRGKDVRCEIEPDLHEQLRKIAEFRNMELSALASELLEKATVGEWHAFTILLERMERSGIVRKAAESGGLAGK